MFDLGLLLFWIIVMYGVPGAIAGLGIFRKTKFTVLEKMLMGFGLFLFITSIIPFLFYILLGIKFTYLLSVLSVALGYVIAILIFWYYYKDEKKFTMLFSIGNIKKKLKYDYSDLTRIVSNSLLIILLLVTFGVRVMNYGPVHFELDPYYYIYIGQQIITQGFNPTSDATAWYPLVVNHRSNPAMAYMESLWYSLYSGGAGVAHYDKYLYATITSVYPALAAMLAVFFMYILVTTIYLYHKHDWSRWLGLFAAGIIAFLPVFYIKLMAGEMEAQPYAFYSLTMFFALMLIAMLYKEIKLGTFAGLAAAAVIMGSSSGSFATAIFLIYPYLLAALVIAGLFYKPHKKTRTDEFEKTVIVFSVAYAIALLTRLILVYFERGILDIHMLLVNLLVSYTPFVFAYILLLINDYKHKQLKYKNIESYFNPIKDVSLMNIILGLLIIGGLIALVTPLGSTAIGIFKGGLGIAQYNAALSRTIAEQPPTGASFQNNLGYIAEVITSKNPLSIIVIPVSNIANWILGIFYGTADALLGTHINYTSKEPNILYFFMTLFFLAIINMLYESVVKEKSRGLMLLMVMVFPPMLLGIMKVKYTIYLGFFFVIGIAIVFGELLKLLDKFKKVINGYHKSTHQYTRYTVYVLLVLLLFSQYSNSFYPALTTGIFKQQFGQNPASFKAHFENINNEMSVYGGDSALCSKGYPCTVYDAPISIVAADPGKYANESITNRYSQKLCYLSLIKDPLHPTKSELLLASTRCQFINNYWLETMEWISRNVDNNDYVTSWWDYGHWINFFGNKDTLLRNEHRSHKMIGAIAYLYTRGTSEELASYMKRHHSKYALFDIESSGIFGGKYGALNYLGCDYTNNTNVNLAPGQSECERNNLWETIYIPMQPTSKEKCQISQYPNRTGVLSYETTLKTINGRTMNTLFPTYCVGSMNISGKKTNVLYYLNRKYKNGDLILNRADIIVTGKHKIPIGTGERDMYIGNPLYTQDTKWYVNGTLTSGWGDRIGKGGFYNSNFYKAFYLNTLPGFNLVFTSKDHKVKIFKIKE